MANLIELLNADLARERQHMMFYLHSSMVIRGAHRKEIGEFLHDQAKEEMDHVREFSNLILGLGGPLSTNVEDYPSNLTSPTQILEYALNMEETVVKNYTQRIDQALAAVDGSQFPYHRARFVQIFLEEQILHSQTDANEIREMLR